MLTERIFVETRESRRTYHKQVPTHAPSPASLALVALPTTCSPRRLLSPPLPSPHPRRERLKNLEVRRAFTVLWALLGGVLSVILPLLARQGAGRDGTRVGTGTHSKW